MRSQVVYCECGQIVAGCVEPYCHDDKDWRKTLKKAVRMERRIDMINNDEMNSDLWGCKCKKENSEPIKPRSVQPELSFQE